MRWNTLLKCPAAESATARRTCRKAAGRPHSSPPIPWANDNPVRPWLHSHCSIKPRGALRRTINKASLRAELASNNRDRPPLLLAKPTLQSLDESLFPSAKPAKMRFVPPHEHAVSVSGKPLSLHLWAEVFEFMAGSDPDESCPLLDGVLFIIHASPSNCGRGRTFPKNDIS